MFFLPSKFSAGTSVTKTQIHKRKTNRNLLTYMPHVYLVDTQEKINNSQRWFRTQA